MYYYRCGDQRGRMVEGYLDLNSRKEARNKLKDEGYKVFDLKKEKGSGKARRRIKNGRDLILFSKIMASLLGSGIALTDSLSSVYTQIKDLEFKEAIGEVIREVKSGESLSASFRKSSRYFSDFYCSVIEGGEKNGVLEVTFTMVYAYLLKKNKIEKKIVSASVYPLFLLVFSMIAIFFLSMVVLPSFANIYDAFEKELPKVTKVVLAVTRGIASYWHLIIIFFGITGYTVLELLKREEYRRKVDTGFLTLKPLKEFIYKKEISSFFSLLSLSIASGMDIVAALNISKKNVGNMKIRDDLELVIKEVVRGQRLSRGLSSVGFPPLAVQFVSAGENSNNLEEMLGNVSEYYERELEESINVAVSLIEPVMIIFVGGVIGVIVMAIMLPILSLSTAIT